MNPPALRYNGIFKQLSGGERKEIIKPPLAGQLFHNHLLQRFSVCGQSPEVDGQVREQLSYPQNLLCQFLCPKKRISSFKNNFLDLHGLGNTNKTSDYPFKWIRKASVLHSKWSNRFDCTAIKIKQPWVQPNTQFQQFHTVWMRQNLKNILFLFYYFEEILSLTLCEHLHFYQ